MCAQSHAQTSLLKMLKTGTYDKRNRLVSIIDRNGNSTIYEYQCACEDECKEDCQYECMCLDGCEYCVFTTRKAKINYPDGTSVRYQYDDSGNVISTVQQDESELAYTYLNGLLVESTDANNGTRTYHYNEAGHLVKSIDALGYTTNYTCNAAGLITSSTDPLGNKTQYEYDIVGRLVKRITPKGYEYRYEYSDAGSKCPTIRTLTQN